jgi:hypothetical protein
MSLLHLINFVITKLCNCLPLRFFLQITEKDMTTIQYGPSTKQKRRNETIMTHAKPTTAAAMAPTIIGNVPILICLTRSCLPCLLLQINTMSSQKYYLSSGKQASPSRTICNRDKYFDSYDVTIPLQHGQCGLWLLTHALLYVEDYYVIFEDYKRDDNGNSLLADKDIMMNFEDVLLAVDGVDIEGKNLGDIMNMLKGKSTNIVTLTFLNKEWFNNFDRDSVKTGTAIQKKR